MEKLLGVITANYSTKYPSVLSETRPVASLPYLGRYRVVDFALSNMVNAGIRTVGMIMPYNYRSLIDHIGSGRDWDLNRKKGGLFILPGSAFGTSRTGARFLLRDWVAERAARQAAAPAAAAIGAQPQLAVTATRAGHRYPAGHERRDHRRDPDPQPAQHAGAQPARGHLSAGLRRGHRRAAVP